MGLVRDVVSQSEMTDFSVQELKDIDDIADKLAIAKNAARNAGNFSGQGLLSVEEEKTVNMVMNKVRDAPKSRSRSRSRSQNRTKRKGRNRNRYTRRANSRAT